MNKRELLDELDLMIANGLIEIVSGFGEDAKYSLTEKGKEYANRLSDEPSK